VIDDILDRKPDKAHSVLSGVNFLVGKLTKEEQHDNLSLQAPDHTTSRAVMAISILDDTPLDEATQRSCSFFGDFLQYVASIYPDLKEQCPSSFGRAMLDQVHRAQLRESLFGHLSSCYCMGTYGCPC
jgi:hypothetical protein